VIRYHGGPITPMLVAMAMRGQHAMISHAAPQQLAQLAEICQSFALDNGAFSVWKAGNTLDVPGYREWVEYWRWHPGFDWCLIPDSIDGTEADNRRLMEDWLADDLRLNEQSVPVWHLHESLERLEELAAMFPRVALGSSGEFKDPNAKCPRWRGRMNQAFQALCDEHGRPRVKVHGLRMMAPTIFSLYPFASVDSTNIARNHGIDSYWDGVPYGRDVPRDTRAALMRDVCCQHPCAYVFREKVEIQNELLFG